MLSFVFLFFVFLAGTQAFAASDLKRLSPVRLSVLTFNAWLLDLPFGFGSRDNAARLTAIPEKVAATHADIIAFQEVWSQQHKDALIMGLKKHGYGYFLYETVESSFWLRGLFGNGLLIVSKFPLASSEKKEQRLLTFKNYTRPEEYFAAKGALYARVQIPGWGDLHFYNTHFGAVSFSEKNRQFDLAHEASRLQQSQELFLFVKKTAGAGPVLIAGDFNAHYQLYKDGAFSSELRKDYTEFVCQSPSESCLNLQDTVKRDSAQTLLTTVDPARNLYIGSTQFYKKPQPVRVLDYLFVSNSEKIKLLETRVVLHENIRISSRAEALPLSDHYALMSRLELR